MRPTRGIQRTFHVAVLTAISLTGCGTIPDLRPFADATADIQKGIASVGNEYASMVPAKLQCKSGKGSCRDQLENVWKPRVAAISAFAAYSDGLAQISNAAKARSDTSDKVIGAAEKLFQAVQIEPLSPLVTALAKKGVQELISYRALRSLEEQISAVSKPLSELADALDSDLSSLASSIDDVVDAAEGEVKSEDNVTALLLRAKSHLNDSRSDVVNQIRDMRGGVVELAKLVRDDSQCVRDECKKSRLVVEAGDKNLQISLKRVTDLEVLVAGLEKSQIPFREKENAIANSGAQIRSAIGKVRVSLREWARVHNGLANDIKASLQPNVKHLVELAKDIRKTVDDLGDKK